MSPEGESTIRNVLSALPGLSARDDALARVRDCKCLGKSWKSSLFGLVRIPPQRRSIFDNLSVE